MNQTYGSAPLYMLQPRALINFAAQTLELASQTLGYRDLAPYPASSKSLSQQKDEETGLEIYSLNEVIMHDTIGDCWIVLYDKVYDVTEFLMEHPGGEDVLLEHAGRDATIAFRGVGHSQAALKALESYQKGILPKEERMFSGEGSCQWETA